MLAQRAAADKLYYFPPGSEGSRDWFYPRAVLIVSDRLPNAIDRYVASRVRVRRLEMGISQDAVAHALGVTFQQFQKYERSINRISAGRLYKIALTLEVQCSFFLKE